MDNSKIRKLNNDLSSCLQNLDSRKITERKVINKYVLHINICHLKFKNYYTINNKVNQYLYELGLLKFFFILLPALINCYSLEIVIILIEVTYFCIN